MGQGGVTFKEKLNRGDLIVGTFVKTPHPHVVEVLATSGLDCVCIDAEHAPFDRRDLDACILAGRAHGYPILVRIPDTSDHAILNALDCGADGVVVPHVKTAAQARDLVRASHYGPGGRGYAGSSRSAGYGLIAMGEHQANSAARTVVVAQIEDHEALNDIDAIANVDGLEALFVGRIDLTVSLGCTNPDDPKVVAAVDAIVAAGVKAGKSVGMFLPRTSDVAGWRAKGVSFFLLGSDHSFMRAGAAALLSDIKSQS
jgi:staphyloferrin B biosynthesis citrate synthase